MDLPFELLDAIFENLGDKALPVTSEPDPDGASLDPDFPRAETHLVPFLGGDLESFGESTQLGRSEQLEGLVRIREPSGRWNNDLASCASVSRLWRNAAIPHLFKRISVTFYPPNMILPDGDDLERMDTPPGRNNRKTLVSFLDFLVESPELRTHIRNLTLRSRLLSPLHGGWPRGGDPHPQTVIAILERSLLPRLSYLELEDVLVNIYSYYDGHGPNCGWYRNVVQGLDRVRLKFSQRSHDTFCFGDIYRTLSIFSVIKHLDLINVDIIHGSEDYLKLDLAVPRPPPAVDALDELEIHQAFVDQSSGFLFFGMCHTKAIRNLRSLAAYKSVGLGQFHSLMLVGYVPRSLTIHLGKHNSFLEPVALVGDSHALDLSMCPNLVDFCLDFELSEPTDSIPNMPQWQFLATFLPELPPPPSLSYVTLRINGVSGEVFGDNIYPASIRSVDQRLSCWHERARENSGIHLVVQLARADTLRGFSDKTQEWFKAAFLGLHERGVLHMP